MVLFCSFSPGLLLESTHGQLNIATGQKAELDGLKNSKISDQKKDYSVAEQTYWQEKRKACSVKEKVETELKSYSSDLKESCCAELTPQNIASAVKQVNAQEDRSKNQIISA